MRAEIERAPKPGPGSRGLAARREPRFREGPVAMDPNRPPRGWPDFSALEALRAYLAWSAAARHDRPGEEDGGAVWVAPRSRAGRPVAGRWRRPVP